MDPIKLKPKCEIDDPVKPTNLAPKMSACHKREEILLDDRLNKKIKTPLIISGGCSGISDIKNAISKKIYNMAVGATFVFKGTHSAVLITYPDSKELGYE